HYLIDECAHCRPPPPRHLFPTPLHDALPIYTAHGHSANVLQRVAWIKRHHPQVQVIGGNIATAEAALALAAAGADGVKVGIGPGDRKSTRLNSSHVKSSYAVFCLKK